MSSYWWSSWLHPPSNLSLILTLSGWLFPLWILYPLRISLVFCPVLSTNAKENIRKISSGWSEIRGESLIPATLRQTCGNLEEVSQKRDERGGFPSSIPLTLFPFSLGPFISSFFLFLPSRSLADSRSQLSGFTSISGFRPDEIKVDTKPNSALIWGLCFFQLVSHEPLLGFLFSSSSSFDGSNVSFIGIM